MQQPLVHRDSSLSAEAFRSPARGNQGSGADKRTRAPLIRLQWEIQSHAAPRNIVDTSRDHLTVAAFQSAAYSDQTLRSTPPPLAHRHETLPDHWTPVDTERPCTGNRLELACRIGHRV